MHGIDGQATILPRKSAGRDALRVAVVDDDPAILDALKTIFEMEGFAVLTFSSGNGFLASEQSCPDCLLLDVHMPVRSGMEVLEAIGSRGYRAPVIMISGQGDIPSAVAAIRAGAHNFIEKPFHAEVIIDLVRETVRIFRERQSPVRRRFPNSETLTPREHDVLDQLTKGWSNKVAARILGISPRTVEVHRARIMEKTGARNAAELMRIVLSNYASALPLS